MSTAATAPVFTHEDVMRLLSAPGQDARAQVAEKIGEQLEASAENTSERGIAEDIIRMLSADVVVQVRQALASSVKASPYLPPDVAAALARDVESVSLPILEFSTVLPQGEMLELAKLGSPEKQQAIARREHVPEAVSAVLVEHGDERVVSTLMSNKTAQISEKTFDKAIDKFGQSQSVQAAIAMRPKLPMAISEKLISFVSDKLKDYLLSQPDLPSGLAADLIIQGREKATMSLFDQRTSVVELLKLVDQLYRAGRLTPSLLLRALCTGDMPFFEASLARLASVPLPNAQQMLHGGVQGGLRGLFDKSHLPANMFTAFRIALDVSRETEFDGLPHDRERRTRRIIERILTQYEGMDDDDVEYLLAKMTDLSGPIPL